MVSITLALGIVLTAAIAAGGAIWLDSWFRRQIPPRPAPLFQDAGGGAVFLFDGEALVDCSPAAKAVLAGPLAGAGPWARLMAFLGPRFPGVEERLAQLATLGQVTLPAADDRGLMLTAEARGGMTRITLLDAEREDHLPGQDPMTLRVMSEEIDLLRQLTTAAPLLIWRERADGAVTWANAAYITRLTQALEPGADIAWPLPALFQPRPESGAAADRRALRLASGATAWYQLHPVAEGAGRLVFALPADQLEQVERSLRDVMLTLTKTFAHLHVGLAIFDRQRQLQLFNPALTDLTGLPADFLARRPTLTAVLDAMRERNTIPEPKDYRSWRRQLIEMERAAASGLYEETWSLPAGQTYRVIGRPHPDGALALILEDISSEMTRSRRYRAQIELGMAVFDGLDEAIAVFAQDGQMVMSNAAYAQLWGGDAATGLREVSLAGVLDQWRQASAPTPIWSALEELAGGGADRQALQAELRLTDGRLIGCRFVPLSGGALMAAFRPRPALAGPTALGGGARIASASPDEADAAGNSPKAGAAAGAAGPA